MEEQDQLDLEFLEQLQLRYTWESFKLEHDLFYPPPLLRERQAPQEQSYKIPHTGTSGYQGESESTDRYPDASPLMGSALRNYRLVWVVHVIEFLTAIVLILFGNITLTQVLQIVGIQFGVVATLAMSVIVINYYTNKSNQHTARYFLEKAQRNQVKLRDRVQHDSLNDVEPSGDTSLKILSTAISPPPSLQKYDRELEDIQTKLTDLTEALKEIKAKQQYLATVSSQ